MRPGIRAWTGRVTGLSFASARCVRERMLPLSKSTSEGNTRRIAERVREVSASSHGRRHRCEAVGLPRVSQPSPNHPFTSPARAARLLRRPGRGLYMPSSAAGRWPVHVTRSRLGSRRQCPVTDRHIRGVIFVRHGVLHRGSSRVNGKTSTVFRVESSGDSHTRVAALQGDYAVAASSSPYFRIRR